MRLALREDDPDKERQLRSCYIASLADGSIIVEMVLGFDAAFTSNTSDVLQSIEDGSVNVDRVAQDLTVLEVDTTAFTVVGKWAKTAG